MATTDQDTSERILDIAERLVQTRGFNGFSYADISAEMGISKASLHYHYPTKAALGQRLVERYEGKFLAALEGIDSHHASALAKLAAYVDIYVHVVQLGQNVPLRDAGGGLCHVAECDPGQCTPLFLG